MISILDFLSRKENRFFARESFDEVFEQKIKHYPTYRQAYEATEEDYEEANGSRRYSSWDSFANVRSHKRKRKR